MFCQQCMDLHWILMRYGIHPNHIKGSTYLLWNPGTGCIVSGSQTVGSRYLGYEPKLYCDNYVWCHAVCILGNDCPNIRCSTLSTSSYLKLYTYSYITQSCILGNHCPTIWKVIVSLCTFNEVCSVVLEIEKVAPTCTCVQNALYNKLL